MGKARNQRARGAGTFAPYGTSSASSPKSINLVFYRTTSHSLQYSEDNQVFKATPGFTSGRRLYIIENTSNNRCYYLGTAQNLKDRFQARIRVLRELGISEDALKDITVYIIRVETNGKPTPPDLSGKTADGIDIEGLLIRTYIVELGKNIQNMSKTSTFKNETGATLRWTIPANFPGVDREKKCTLAQGKSL